MPVETSSPKTEMIDPALLEGVSANFIVKAPSGLEKAYPMQKVALTVGRSDQCDISVKDSSMSGRHAEIRKSDGEIKVRDLGSANGIYLNGERVEEAELFDGDVLRLGQTSVRVDVVGGRKRPSGGVSAKLVAAIVLVVVALGAGGIAAGLTLKKKAQHRRDVATAAKFVAAAREGHKSKPCAAGVVVVQDVAKTLNSMPRVDARKPPRGDQARRIVGGYRDLAQKYNTLAIQVAQFAGKDSESAQAVAFVLVLLRARRIRGRHRAVFATGLPPLDPERERLVDAPQALYHGTRFADGTAVLAPRWRDPAVGNLWCTDEAIFLDRET